MVVTLGLGLAACVSAGKYNTVANTLKACQQSHTACNQKSAALEQQVASLNAEREKERVAYKEAQSEAGASKTELETLRKQNAETEKRLAQYQALRTRFQKMLDEKKLTIGVRNGLMILGLPAGVLFASGKATLSKEGQNTVSEVATALKEMPDRHFLVAGHTDNLPVKGGKFKDNWDLSTARAVVVARTLLQDGIAPKQLGAAGYSEYDPIAENTTNEGRQENRRIEIVVMPNMEEILKIPVSPTTPTKSK
jgi:chemotaxis protein MotB